MPLVKAPSHYQPESIAGRRSWRMDEAKATSATTLTEFYDIVLADLTEEELLSIVIEVPEHLRHVDVNGVPLPQDAVRADATVPRGIPIALGVAALARRSDPTQSAERSEGDLTRRSFMARTAAAAGAAMAFCLFGSRPNMGAVASEAGVLAGCDCYKGKFYNSCDRTNICAYNGQYGRQAVFDHFGWSNNCGTTCSSVYRGMLCC